MAAEKTAVAEFKMVEIYYNNEVSITGLLTLQQKDRTMAKGGLFCYTGPENVRFGKSKMQKGYWQQL